MAPSGWVAARPFSIRQGAALFYEPRAGRTFHGRFKRVARRRSNHRDRARLAHAGLPSLRSQAVGRHLYRVCALEDVPARRAHWRGGCHMETIRRELGGAHRRRHAALAFEAQEARAPSARALVGSDAPLQRAGRRPCRVSPDAVSAAMWLADPPRYDTPTVAARQSHCAHAVANLSRTRRRS